MAQAQGSRVVSKRIRLSVGMAQPKVTKTIKLSDFGDADTIEIKLELGSGSYGASVGYLEINGVKSK